MTRIFGNSPACRQSPLLGGLVGAPAKAPDPSPAVPNLDIAVGHKVLGLVERSGIVRRVNFTNANEVALLV
jgi:hypothetical protein